MRSRSALLPDLPAAPATSAPALRALRAGLLQLTLALLVACATRAPQSDGDGPEARPPPALERTPDAVPRVEALRNGGPNRPYEVGGRRYVPLTADLPLRERGLASWYGRKFHGRPTASGERYDMYAMTAAHPTMPLPSYATVRNPANGRQVVVRVNDRGPFVSGRIIDLSYTAALRLGLLGGVAAVEVERLTHDDIRSGRWEGAALAPDDPAPGDEARPVPLAVTDAAAAGFWLQLGAFRSRDAALALQQRLQLDAAGLAPGLALLDEDGMHRLHAGPWASRARAQQAAEQLRQRLGLAGLVVERR